MSNTISSDRGKNRFNLSLVVALSLTYKRILKSCFVMPFLTIVAPFVWKLTCMISDRITDNHSLLSLFLTSFFTFLLRRMIRQSAPSKEKASESLAKTEVRLLPCILFVVSVLFIRFFVTPFEEVFGLKNMLKWSPSISFSSAMRLAIGMSLLSISVVSRFVGPASVVRCSSSPLLAHPFTAMAASTLSHFHSAGAFLDFIAGPNNESSSLPPGAMVTSDLTYQSETARRLQRPMLAAVSKQIVLSALLGIALAYTLVLPFCDGIHGDLPHKSPLISSCAFATVMSLARLLDGSSHEINPNRYGASHGFMSILSVVQKMPLFSSFGVLFLALICSSLSIEDINGDTTGKVITTCLFTILIITLYLNVFEEILRVVLCSPPNHMKAVVEEIADDDRMETFLEVAMCSILHSEMSLVDKLSRSVKGPLLNLDREELAMNEESVKAMAHILLQKTAADENGAHLEEDILRLSLLASLGASKKRLNGEIDQNFQQWVQPRNTIHVGTSVHEYFTVPLVRALCAYAGGLGEALVTICSSMQNNRKTPLGSPWLLPPGAIVCAEYAIRAATGFIVWTLSNSERCSTDWRGSHLSMLIPVLLNSAHRLEAGMIKYTELRRGIPPYTELPRRGISSGSDSLVIAQTAQLTLEQKLRLIKTESPELFSLYQTCNDAAVAIIEKLKTLEGSRQIDLPIFGDCRVWIDGILARISPLQRFGHSVITN